MPHIPLISSRIVGSMEVVSAPEVIDYVSGRHAASTSREIIRP